MIYCTVKMKICKITEKKESYLQIYTSSRLIVFEFFFIKSQVFYRTVKKNYLFRNFCRYTENKFNSTNYFLQVVEFLSKNINKNITASAIFLDVGKAFDKVWHLRIILKLIKLGYLAVLFHLINSYLSDRNYVSA